MNWAAVNKESSNLLMVLTKGSTLNDESTFLVIKVQYENFEEQFKITSIIKIKILFRGIHLMSYKEQPVNVAFRAL